MTIITIETLAGEFVKQITTSDNWFNVYLEESKMRGSKIKWLNPAKTMYETKWHDKDKILTVSRI